MIDYHMYAVGLLNVVANIILDRDVKPGYPVFFSGDEIKIVEEWINHFVEFLVDNRPDCGE